MTAPARSQMDELLDLVSQLVDRVLLLEQRGPQQLARKADRPAIPFRWENLDPDQTRDTWQKLGHWVRWLCQRFRIDDIPPCWYQHGDLVEELTALWLAWEGSYYSDARFDDPVRWLDWLARTRTRLARRSPRCGIGTHKEHGLGQTHDDSVFAVFVAQQSTATVVSATGS